MKCFGLHVIVNLTLISVAVIEADMFTSIAKLEPLIATEDQLLVAIQKYVHHEKQRINDIERLIDHIKKERLSPNSNDTSMNIGDPIQSFLFLRRLRRQWIAMKRHVNMTEYQQQYVEIAEQYENSHNQYPTEDDYKGSAEALLRLQETYGLQTSSISDGNLLGEHNSPPLLADDCFDIGMIVKERDTNRRIEWIQEAKRRRIKDQPNLHTEMEILEQLADSFYQKKEYKKALENIVQILKQDPNNTIANKRKRVYQRALKYQQLNDESTAYEKARYMALCRGDETAFGQQKHPEEMRCRYAHYNRPRLFIRPAKEEMLFSEPRIVFYHDIVTEKEIEIIKDRALPHLKRSHVHDVGVSKVRISSTTWLNIHDTHDVLGKILPRVQDYTGLSTSPNDTELLQVSNYGLGGYYDYHYDDETDGVSDGFNGMGKRIATVLFYLSDVDAGGATVFSKAGVRVAPIKGGAVVWYNYLKNGDRDLMTRHAGCPVLMGKKWASNLWIHEFGQVFRRRCGLNREDKY